MKQINGNHIFYGFHLSVLGYFRLFFKLKYFFSKYYIIWGCIFFIIKQLPVNIIQYRNDNGHKDIPYYHKNNINLVIPHGTGQCAVIPHMIVCIEMIAHKALSQNTYANGREVWFHFPQEWFRPPWFHRFLMCAIPESYNLHV